MTLGLSAIVAGAAATGTRRLSYPGAFTRSAGVSDETSRLNRPSASACVSTAPAQIEAPLSALPRSASTTLPLTLRAWAAGSRAGSGSGAGIATGPDGGLGAWSCAGLGDGIGDPLGDALGAAVGGALGAGDSDGLDVGGT